MTSLLGRTDGQTDGQTDGRSDPTPRPAFAVGDAGKNSYISPERVFVQTYLKIFIKVPYDHKTHSFMSFCLLT